MRSFTDNAGRSWEVTINVDAIKRVRSLCDVDLMSIVEGDLLRRLVVDPVLLCDVLYVVCKPQADAKGVTDEEFGRAMAGDAIDHATRVMLDELADFFPSPRDRATQHRVLETVRTAMDRHRDVVEERLNGGELDRVVEQALANAGMASGSAPASSESNRDLPRFENSSPWPRPDAATNGSE